MHKIDPSTGEDIASSGIALPLADMAYSYVESTPDMPLFASIYEGWLLAPDDPMNISGSGFNLTSYVANYGASKFIALTSGGASEVETEDGLVAGEQFVAIDNAGNVWDFLLTDTTIYWNTYRSVLPVGFLGGNTKGEYCSLAYGTDGYLYLSAFDGNTANYYRIALSEESAMASYFGNVGDGVWPSTIISATVNAPAAAAYANSVKAMTESASVSEFDVSEGSKPAEAAEEIAFEEELSEVNILNSASAIVEKLEKVTGIPEAAAFSLDSGIALTADEEGETIADETVSDATVTNKNVELQLKAQANKEAIESTNGLFVVKYNADALKFVNTEDHNGIYSSHSIDEENGLLIVAYASPSYIISENEPAQTVNFEVVNEALASESTFEVTALETDSSNKLAAVPKTDENGNIVRDENGAIVYETPVTVDVSKVTEQLENIVKALVEEYPELEEAIRNEYAPENVAIKAGTPVDPDPKPDYPSGGSFTDPTVTTESAETTAPSETTATSSGNAEPDVTTGDNVSGSTDSGDSVDNGGISNGDLIDNADNTADNGSSDNTGNISDSTDNAGSTDSAGEDKNINTGALLFIAPAAVSALAVLVSKKRRS